MNQEERGELSGPVDSRTLDRLLSKYVGVWVWSVLFGTTTGLLFSFMTFQPDRWNRLIGIVLAVPAAMSLLLVLMSWLQLYFALRHHILPQFLARGSQSGNAAEQGPGLAYNLQRAFYFFIFAAVLRAAVSILELLIGSAGGGGF